MAKARAAVVYHLWPHYRAGVVAALDASGRVEFDFLGSGAAYHGIKPMAPAQFSRFVPAPFRHFGALLWQPGAIAAARSGRYDAFVFLADPKFVSTWIAAAIARLRGKPVLFWAHGWLRPERTSKRILRDRYFRLAHRVLLYAERGKRLGRAAGFPDDRMVVVYNSLDVDRADDVVARIEAGTLSGVQPRAWFADPARPLAICTARLTPVCRFDLLLRAAALLRDRGRPINVLLVGDGPEREALARLADALGVDVHFYGACYDEDVIGQLLYHSDLTVSPGKIGLTAMHTLMYGTPAVTHDTLDEQMPEVEALTEGVTGTFFRRDDPDSLADAIDAWLSTDRDRQADRDACRAVVHDRWNPHVQAAIIEDAILSAIDDA